MRSDDHAELTRANAALFNRLPEAIQQTLNTEQRLAIAQVLAEHRQHRIDWRPVIKLPLLPWTFYCVLLAGRNQRALSEREQRAAAWLTLGILLGIIISLCLVGLIMLYMIKSAVGIDLFANHHLGIWTWFDENFLQP